MPDAMVVIGVGGIGTACARRMGFGRHVFLADADGERLAAIAHELTTDGYRVTHRQLDVSNKSAITAFADEVRLAGRLCLLVNTAGLSARIGRPDLILAVNLLGNAYVFDAFLPLASAGTVAVSISSIGGNIGAIPEEAEKRLALAPADQLLEAAKEIEGWDSGGGAYWISKRAAQLRAEAAAAAWGLRGARVASVSPGVIATPMNRIEKAKFAFVDEMGMRAPMQRLGTAQDIASVIEWLASPQASFVTGADIRTDGGLLAAQRWSGLEPRSMASIGKQASNEQ